MAHVRGSGELVLRRVTRENGERMILRDGTASTARRRVKKSLTGSAILVVIIVLAILVSSVNHRVRLHLEESLITPPGTMVSVAGHSMHVYTEGEGASTLVFMAGGGTASPVLDFKRLYSQLSGEFKIAVVERFGYGYSDVADEPRDVDTVLDETRQALTEAGADGPYVLFPHSMAGLTAIHWAQQHPAEVSGIVGLDAAVPDSYSDVSMPNVLLLDAFSWAADLGITRLVPSFADGQEAIASGSLSTRDEKTCRAIVYRRTETRPMIDEIETVKANAAEVKASPPPQVPMLFFTSTGEGTGVDTKTWRKHQKDFLMHVPESRQVLLDSEHYVHDYRAEEIARESTGFIDTLSRSRAH